MDASNESLANAVASLLKTADKGYVVKEAVHYSEDQLEEEGVDGEGGEQTVVDDKLDADSACYEQEGIQEGALNEELKPEIAAYRFLQPTSAIVRDTSSNNDDEANTLLRNDVNTVLNDIDKATDYTLLCMVNLCVILTFSEILKQKDVYTKNIMNAHKISADFISSTLKSVYDVLGKQLPASDAIQYIDIRDLTQLRTRFKDLTKIWSAQMAADINAADHPKKTYKFLKISRKFEFLHALFAGMDIHIFPRFVDAHKGGCKSATFSEFDSALWLTGGYDGIVRIHDLREGIPTGADAVPLAQFIGHKSIVSEVHFTKKDQFVLSCSFDRTLKRIWLYLTYLVWNSQTGGCEKTLTGHTDSVTTCHISKDSRFAASGSMDCTVRFWDLNTGQCLTVVKKHTRWVKKVRFSDDGRYLTTAGLDK